MFYQWFLQQCGTNHNFPAFVTFTDEAQFTRDTIPNFHNQHLWADAILLQNIWDGICGDNLSGPHLLQIGLKTKLRGLGP
jgi:hypothetical protein